MVKVVLYTTDCPKCRILKKRLDNQNIQYTVCSDKELMLERGFTEVPMLEVNNQVFNFTEGLNWIKEQSEQEGR